MKDDFNHFSAMEKGRILIDILSAPDGGRPLAEALSITLIAGGANLALKDSNGFDAMEWAVTRGAAPVVRHMISAGYDVVPRTDLLPRAIKFKHTETAILLIEAGVPCDTAEGPENYTPLMMAVMTGQAAVAESLLHRHAALDTRSAAGETAEDIARRLSRNSGDKSIVIILKKARERRARAAARQKKPPAIAGLKRNLPAVRPPRFK